MEGDLLTRSVDPEEVVKTALDWAVSRLLNAFGTGLHALPPEGEATVMTRFGEAVLEREALRFAVRRVYSECMPAGEVASSCAETLKHAQALHADGERAALTEERLNGMRSIWSCLSPGRMHRDDAVAAGSKLIGTLPFKVSQAFLTNAAWETFGCLMAGLGSGLPPRYFLLMIEADFTPLPFQVSLADANSLKEGCASLQAYAELIERRLRLP